MKALVDHRNEGERVLGRVTSVDDVRYAQTGDIGFVGQPGTVDRVGLEYRQCVERDDRPDGTLDLGKAQVVVVEKPRLLGLESNDELAQRLPRIERHSDGQSVDEQADHRLDVIDLRRPSGHCRAEQHIRSAGQGCQDGSPRGLNEGVHGDSAFARNCPQARGRRRVQ